MRRVRCLTAGGSSALRNRTAMTSYSPFAQVAQTIACLFSANPEYARMHLCASAEKGPDKPFVFLMMLRKHLIHGRILSIDVPMMDRVIHMKVQATNDLGDRVNAGFHRRMHGQTQQPDPGGSERFLFWIAPSAYHPLCPRFVPFCLANDITSRRCRASTMRLKWTKQV